MHIGGSGRTDSGVHAFAQEASVVLGQRMDTEAVFRKINELLPEDIRVLRIQEMQGQFHARKSACAKCYEYYVDLRDKPDVFTRRYRFHFPKKIDVEAMRRAAKRLEGKHDFASFTDLKDSNDTVRTIYEIGIEKTGNQLRISYLGNGFLYHMVRILTGTLLEVGAGRIAPEEMGAILMAKDRTWSGFPASAKGLFLKQVYYEPIEQMEK